MTRGDGALRPRALRTLIVAIGIFLALPVAAASADAPPGPYFNGFETNTAGWFNYSGATITRVPSFSDSSGYADMIPSASGDYHARLGLDPSPASCVFGGGVAPIHFGPYTNWGGYSSIFPTGGYTTRVDVYLDVQWAQAHLDRRYDWSSAINNTTGGFRRDFVFNVGTNPLGFVMSASNNSTRCSSFPANPARMPVQISVSGWYTFEHVFTGVPGGPLVVAMRVINKATSATVGTWVLSDPTDLIGVTVGGNRYGWFVQNEIDDLAIDNSERTGVVSTPGCDVKINNGGRITALNTDTATFGGHAKASESGATSGEQTYQDHGPVQPFRIKALTVQAVICSDDLTEAEIYGLASVDGAGEHEYRIKLRDGGEPSTDDRYGIVVPSIGYASGDQPLEGGNVQIRGETS